LRCPAKNIAEIPARNDIEIRRGKADSSALVWIGAMMLEPEENFEFLDLVVEAFGDTAKQLIAKADSMKDLNTICYGSLLAACILHCEKLGVELAEESVHRMVDEIFVERREREAMLSSPTDATLH
jgi:hypothetical protein